MRYRALVEAPAGLASFSLYVHGGRHCRPPISRMGNKAGYAHALAALADIQPGEGAGAYVWAEADADVRALLRVYPDAAALLRIAEIIRGWKDEEPRALWERLRAERKARKPADSDTEAARFVWVLGRSMNCYDGSTFMPERSAKGTEVWNAHPPEYFAEQVNRLAEFALLGQWSYRRGEPESGLNHGLLEDRAPTATGGHAARGRTAEAEAGGFERVAGMVLEHRWSFSQKGPSFGYGGPGTDPGAFAGRDESIGCDATAAGIGRLASRWPPVAVLAALPTSDALAALLGTPGDLDGVLVYMDPPYRNTTGYASDLPRAEVVAHAIDYARLGARVMVSEAVAVEELVTLGWEATDIGHARRGQKRTFARVGSEVVTLNFTPVRTQERAVQVAMFDSVRP